MKNQLLPEGFRDSLLDAAETEFKINNICLELMKKFGFQYVKPPLVEFENSLFLNNEKQKNESFRILDPLSQKVMAIRSDITSQIARISCGSLSKISRPLKLCYSGEVLKVKNNNLSISRQSTQLGAEIIGISDNLIILEIIDLIVKILKKLKFKNNFINLSMPNLVRAISKDYKLCDKDHNLLVNGFKNKNLDEIDTLGSDVIEISRFLLSCIGDAQKSLNKLKVYKFKSNIDKEVLSFTDAITNIKTNFKRDKIYIDPLEVDEINYHCIISFKIYSESFTELFNGGFYEVNGERCIGFSGLVENLIKK